MAATRFYLDDANNASVNLAAQVQSLWESNIASAFPTKKLITVALGNANTNHLTNVGTGTNPNDVLFFQGMSLALPAQTISGTFKGNIVCRESSLSANAYTNIGIYVVDSTGVYKATLYGGTTAGGTEYNNPSGNNRNLPRQGGDVALTSYTCVAGDRIVVEIGTRLETTNTTFSIYMYFGDGVTADLPTGDGTDNSLTKRPWVEFSADLFNPPAGGARNQAWVYG